MARMQIGIKRHITSTVQNTVVAELRCWNACLCFSFLSQDVKFTVYYISKRNEVDVGFFCKEEWAEFSLFSCNCCKLQMLVIKVLI